jgi:RNA polymerase sigma factor (sigma-70 family)
MRGFETTQWSTVLAASQSTGRAREALATLCQIYWYPLYAYLRRGGHTAEDAEDLTQGFFTHLLEKGALRSADPERGRFRSFLLASLRHYVSNERARARADKRGGSTVLLPLHDAEGRYRREPPDDRTPEKLLDRRWALAVLDRVAATLRDEFRRRGKEAVFDGLKEYLAGDAEGPSYREIGVRLGLSEGAARVAVYRLRRRFGELLRKEVGQTLASPQDIEDEIRCLIRALAP